jgi:hypothetical protein
VTERSAILAKLAQLAAAGADHKDLAERLCEAARVMLAVDGVWITVQGTQNQQLSLGATDPTAAALEDLEDVIGQGPARSAFEQDSEMTAILQEQADPRWPEFSRAAWHRFGPLTVQAFPMHPDHQPFGVLACYFNAGTTWTESAETAQFLADTIGAALLQEPVPEPDRALTNGMWSARAEIHQATGMVVAQLRISVDDALALLRAHAYAHDTTLSGIAHQIVTRQLDFRGDS